MQGIFSAIILAAGRSSRMGRFKPLLNLGNQTIIERVITLFREAGIEDVRVVVGYRRKEILPFVEDQRAKAVVNPNYLDGMFSSVVSGLASLGPEVDAFFVLPVDVPLVRSGTICRLRKVYEGGPKEIVHPSFGGIRGHPPLISATYINTIMGWNGKGGLKAILKHFESRAVQVEVPDEYVLFDVDTPEDYEELLDRWYRYKSPPPGECQVALPQNHSVYSSKPKSIRMA